MRTGTILFGVATWAAAALPAQTPAPLATFSVHGERHRISSDERFALLEAADGVQLVDLTAAVLVPLPVSGPWMAGAFDATSRHLWLVDAQGTARGFVLPTRRTPATSEWVEANVVEIGVPKLDDAGRSPRFRDLVIADDGRHLAWSTMAGGVRVAGVHTIATGEEVARFENVAFGSRSGATHPWIAFVGTGAHVVVHLEADRRGLAAPDPDRSGMVVYELASRRPSVRLSPCAAAATPGYALLPDGVVVGERRGMCDWAIVRWRLGSGASTEFVAAARGGHFTDLHAEPGGRVVCEWDFEDRETGIQVRDLDGARPPIVAAKGHAFVGFATPAERDAAGGVLAFGTDATLRRFASDDGRMQAEHATGAGFRITAARWSDRSQRLLAIGAVDTATPRPAWQARVWAAPPVRR